MGHQNTAGPSDPLRRKRKKTEKRIAKRGRIPLHKQYPLAEFAVHFLNSRHGAADRSRSTVSYELSSTMTSMKRFVDSCLRTYCASMDLPLPKNMPSIYTLRRLGIAPDRKLGTSHHYKEIVPFKRAPRNVNLAKDHADFHYSGSIVVTHLELASHFRDEVLMLSCDNKNKIILGAPAIQASRRPVGMFSADAMPQMPDHSFPEEDGKITPQGYMLISCERESEFEPLFRTRHESLKFDKPPFR